MDKNFNSLSPAELERLAILAEEMEEALQEIGKILRHGYDACNPNTGITNRRSLEIELGDVRHAMIMLCDAKDVRKDAIHEQADYKKATIGNRLHHHRCIGGNYFSHNSVITKSTLKFEPKKSSDEFLESLYVEVEQTLPDLLKIKKRLCLVWNYNRHDAAIRVVISFDPNQIYSYRVSDAAGYKYAEMLADDEIKQYLNEE